MGYAFTAASLLTPVSSSPTPSFSKPEYPPDLLPSRLTPPPDTTFRRTISTPSQSHPPQGVDTKCELAFYAGRGFGIKATTSITLGEEIIAEEPFITFTHPTTSLGVTLAFSRCSEQNRVLFLSFTGTVPDEPDLFVNIAETNAIPMYVLDEDGERLEGDGSGAKELGHSLASKALVLQQTIGEEDNEEEDGMPSGIFEHISRANHSCTPNSGWRWDATLQKLVLTAYADVELGEEITVAYLSILLRPRDFRRSKLQETFGFLCHCCACTRSDDDIKESDARISVLHRINERWIHTDVMEYGYDWEGAIDEIHLALRLAGEEKKYEVVARGIAEQFFLHASWGRLEKARISAAQAFERYTMLRGVEEAREMGFEKWMTKPEAYEGWGVCLLENGGVEVSALKGDDQGSRLTVGHQSDDEEQSEESEYGGSGNSEYEGSDDSNHTAHRRKRVRRTNLRRRM